MKILWVTPDLPEFPGNASAARLFCLLKYLSSGNKITLITIVRKTEDCEKLEPIRQFCVSIHTVEKTAGQLKRRIKSNIPHALFGLLRFLKSLRHPWSFSPNMFPSSLRPLLSSLVDEYDALLVDHSNAAQDILWFEPNGRAARVLVWQNVHSLRLQRIYHQERNLIKKMIAYIDLMRMLHYEQNITSKFDLNVLLSSAEESALHGHVKSASTSIVPFGIDVDYFASFPPRKTVKGRVIFTGTLSHPVHVDAMLYFSNEILPLISANCPEAQLWIVGKDPDKRLEQLAEVRNQINVTGSVPDIRPFIAESQVYVVPIRAAAGVRIKILEALAMGKAVVSTSVGCEGLGLENGRQLLVADTPQSFAEAVCSLFRDPQLRDRLGRQGQDYVRENYDWKVLAPRFEAILQQVVDKKKDGTPSRSLGD